MKAVGDGYVIGCNSTRVFVIKNGCMELERSFPTIRFGSFLDFFYFFFIIRLHTVSYGGVKKPKKKFYGGERVK